MPDLAAAGHPVPRGLFTGAQQVVDGGRVLVAPRLGVRAALGMGLQPELRDQEFEETVVFCGHSAIFLKRSAGHFFSYVIPDVSRSQVVGVAPSARSSRLRTRPTGLRGNSS